MDEVGGPVPDDETLSRTVYAASRGSFATREEAEAHVVTVRSKGFPSACRLTAGYPTGCPAGRS